jgi:hypothetical protein
MAPYLRATASNGTTGGHHASAGVLPAPRRLRPHCGGKGAKRGRTSSAGDAGPVPAATAAASDWPECNSVRPGTPQHDCTRGCAAAADHLPVGNLVHEHNCMTVNCMGDGRGPAPPTGQHRRLYGRLWFPVPASVSPSLLGAVAITHQPHRSAGVWHVLSCEPPTARSATCDGRVGDVCMREGRHGVVPNRLRVGPGPVEVGRGLRAHGLRRPCFASMG